MKNDNQQERVIKYPYTEEQRQENARKMAEIDASPENRKMEKALGITYTDEERQRIQKEDLEIMENIDKDLATLEEAATNEKMTLKEALEYIQELLNNAVKETIIERGIPADKEEDFAILCFQKVLITENGEPQLQIFADVNWKNPAIIKAACNRVADQMLSKPLRSIKPTKAVMNISKVANEATSLENKTETELDLGGNKKPIKTIVSLSYDDENISFIGRPFSSYDRAVYDAICSLYAAGNKGFTSNMVFRAMNGITDTRKINESQLDKVTASIEKLRHLWLKIDVTNQAEEKGYNNLLSIGKNEYNPMDGRQRIVINDSMLSCKNIIAILEGGVHAAAWYFNTTPTLYDYSRSIGQILTVEPKYLNIETTSLTDNNIVMRNYIIRRIEGMKNSHNALKNTNIRYDSIYNEIGGFNDPNKQTNAKNRNRAKTNVIAILDDLKEKGLFKSYQEYKDGRTLAGVMIKI